MITFIQQRHIKWIKSDCKKVKGYKISIPNKVLFNFLFMKTFWEKL